MAAVDMAPTCSGGHTPDGYAPPVRGVAQFGSAPALGAGGREFKSPLPDHIAVPGAPHAARAHPHHARMADPDPEAALVDRLPSTFAETSALADAWERWPTSAPGTRHDARPTTPFAA